MRGLLEELTPLNPLADSNLVNLIIVAVAATGGIFLAIVLGGLLSALIVLGALELYFRAKIHQSSLEQYFKILCNSSQDTYDKLETFLIKKYPEHHDIAEYSKKLFNIFDRRDLVPMIAQMDAESLYRLHYRQICGQLTAVVNNEAVQRAANQALAPLTDVLTFLSSQRNRVLQTPFEVQSPKGEANDIARADLDLALREIDGIQAKLGNSISNATFPYVFLAWSMLYVPFLISTAIYLPFLHTDHAPPVSDWAWLFIPVLAFSKYALAMTLATLVGIVLSLGSAVFGGVAITWLDRILASK